MKCNTRVLFFWLAFLIIQTSAVLEKMHNADSKIYNLTINVEIDLVKLRVRYLELLEKKFASSISVLQNWYNNEASDNFNYDTQVGLFCLQEVTTKIFTVYEETRLTMANIFNENLIEFERRVATKFQAGVEINNLINGAINDCKKQKNEYDQKIDCSSADFKNITRSVLKYTETDEAIAKLAYELTNQMKISCKNSINFFLQESNVTEKMNVCMENYSKIEFHYVAIDGNQTEDLSLNDNENIYTVN